MLAIFRKSRIARVIAMFIALNMVGEIVAPTVALALTGGPSQPEVQSFAPIGANDMVDVFTGDFNYNIPLLDVDGYPINLIYNAGVGMDQEASWVGLGWNLNPGAITRDVRGLPDDFAGDKVVKKSNMKNNITVSASAGLGGEFSGVPLGLRYGLGVSYNNYKGISVEQSVNLSITAGSSAKGSLTGSLGINSSSSDGITISPSVSLSKSMKKMEGVSGGLSLGLSFNSRSGLKALTMSASLTQKKDGVSASTSTSSSISFGMQSYLPQVTTPMRNFAATFSLKGGVDVFLTDATGDISGTFATQHLRYKEQVTPAFGYLYTEQGKGDEVLLDFNREKDGAFTENTPNLPLTNYTYDVYSVSGQGVGGTYRPFRNDIGTLFDAKAADISDSYSLGGEIAGGGIFHVGVDVAVTDVRTTSGKWDTYNDAFGLLPFRNASETNDPLYEPFYFKQVGEAVVEKNTPFIEAYASTNPLRIALQKNETVAKAIGSYLVSYNGTNTSSTPVALPTYNYRNEGNMSSNFKTDVNNASLPAEKINPRPMRNQAISLLTFNEALNGGVGLHPADLTAILDMVANTTLAGGSGSITPEMRDEVKRQIGHHIAQITVLRPDGARYVYGLPLYNFVQKEVSFNVSGQAPDCENGLVAYTSTDASSENAKGLNNYYNATHTPPYAHGYMLSAIVSPDYSDITGDGLSPDDLGTYTRFNYAPIAGDDYDDLYKWRVPFEENMANFSEGLKHRKGADGDDMGSYLYGVKDLRFISTIETKNYIAHFVTSDRNDAWGSAGETGGLPGGTNQNKKLKRIDLYSRHDVISNGNNFSLCTPIKSVHFVYEYSLCQGVGNNDGGVDPDQVELDYLGNDGGKLTLRQIYFTYGNSLKGKFNKYTFDYGAEHTNANPDFHHKAYDRWGGYKPAPSGITPVDCGNDPTSAIPPNAEFPYVEQDGNSTNGEIDEYAGAWNLKKITLPSGGEIDITYEADDYAYVQDKQAMQMFKVLGVGDDENFVTENDLYDGSCSSDPKPYLYFKLQSPISDNKANADAEVQNMYLNGIEKLYFRFLVNLTNSTKSHYYGQNKNYEYVSGYAKVAASGVASTDPDGPYDYGYILLDEVSIRGNPSGSGYNPIAIAAMQFSRLNTPHLAFNQSPPNQAGIIPVIKALVNSSIIKNLKEMFQDPNKPLCEKNYGQEVNLSRSMVRLNNPKKAKKGGGHRVKMICVSDGWNDMAGGATSSYTQLYDYTMQEDGATISSGVAAYEPSLGNEENPWRMPIAFGEKDEKLLVPDDEHYLEGPMGESFFPSPVVGYRRVTVKSIKDCSPTSASTGTGHVVHEFYTAYDFPTIVRQTDLGIERIKPNPVGKLFKLSAKDEVVTSQGYVVELNDMHGKPKSQFVYAEGKSGSEYISGMEYKYKHTGKQLNNSATVITSLGKQFSADIGLEIDLVADVRQQTTIIHGGGLSINTAGFMAGPIPIVVPTILPNYGKETTKFSSVVMTKVVRRYGLLEETIAYDLGSRISTQNLAYDAETGSVLLTKTQNEFHDALYSFTYPAHWAYDGMGHAYKNVGASFSDGTLTGGLLTFSGLPATYKKYFMPGDELLFEQDLFAGDRIGWVKAVDDNGITVINRLGITALIPGTTTGINVKILRSGRRNQQSNSIGSIVSRSNPLLNFRINSFAEVIDANAVEYGNEWQTFCECDNVFNSTNEYLIGVQGNWKPLRSHAFLTERLYARVNANTDARNDGLYKAFTPFWNLTGPIWKPVTNNWTWASEVTEFSPYTVELENRDPLNIYSAATYGYNQTLPTAVGANTQHREIGFDGFEDYPQNICADDHFSFRTNLSSDAALDNTQSHTGRGSIKVTAGNSVIMEKVLVDGNCPPDPKGRMGLTKGGQPVAP